jgi:hypothetical protein
MLDDLLAAPGTRMTVDLRTQTVTGPHGRVEPFASTRSRASACSKAWTRSTTRWRSTPPSTHSSKAARAARLLFEV